jgi:hypothetical protein
MIHNHKLGHEKTKKRKIISNKTTREVTTREARRYCNGFTIT